MSYLTHWLDDDTHFLWALPVATFAAELLGAALAVAFTRRRKTEGDPR